MWELAPDDFQALFEAVPGLYVVLTPDLRIIGASDAYLRATMIRREEVLGHGIFEVFPDNPDDPNADGVRNLRASLQRVLETRQGDAMAVQKYDVRRPASEGGGFEERYWSSFNAPVLKPSGEIACIIHRVEDVTEFIRLKQAGVERDRLALELQDRAGKMEAEIYQRAQQVAEANRQLTRANESLAKLYDRIALLMRRAGDELRAGDALAPSAPMARGDMLARIEQLIVGHKRLEEELRQSQKMEALGRLAGGVAHDFNNLLTVIAGYASLARQSQADGVEPMELDEIEKAVMRAAALTRKLLAFSRRQALQPQVMSLNTVVGGIEEMLRRLIGEDIVLEILLSEGLGLTRVDAGAIEQVIMNLAVNARDAMPAGGRLIIETRNVHLDAEFRSLRPGRYVVLSATDTGHGMDAETAGRVFEPFFTTKEPGKGTGLGLSIVYGIVEQSGGTVTVDSAPGLGTTFRVYLPADSAPANQDEAEAGSVSTATETGTILLVEDEAPLRKLISTVLSDAGHCVLEAVNGEEAVALALSHPHIDLLLTDVVMPGLGGPDLAARLRATRPELAVLYMSGYDRDGTDPKTVEDGGDFLAKPFTPEGLLAKIGERLAAQRRKNAGGREGQQGL